jgi:hypothetical protein
MVSYRYAQAYGRIAARMREQEWENNTPEGRAAKAARERAEADAEAARLARDRKMSAPIPCARNPIGIVFGTRVKDAQDEVVPVRQLRHMLLCGVTGAGKSVLLHSVVWQLVNSPEVETIYAVDLKGGLEFNRYAASGKVHVVWEYADVVKIIDELMALARLRQEIMRENNLQNWPHGRTFVVIDEFAELQTSIDVAADREEKAIAKRLAANLLSLSRRARALGIVLVCAIQKATQDAMDSSFRGNLTLRLVLRTNSKATAQGLFELGDDLRMLPVCPTQLPTGRYYYYDPARGLPRLLQTHIAPGITV